MLSGTIELVAPMLRTHFHQSYCLLGPCYVLKDIGVLMCKINNKNTPK